MRVYGDTIDMKHLTAYTMENIGAGWLTIFNEYEEAGRKSRTFDARGLLSGVYSHRFYAGNLAGVKNMILFNRGRRGMDSTWTEISKILRERRSRPRFVWRITLRLLVANEALSQLSYSPRVKQIALNDFLLTYC